MVHGNTKESQKVQILLKLKTRN